ncbi:exodeoxyribonuclease V subunit gamma [Vibrio chagasii]|nr:exodeoxyribonuclease V subunit gamma [Vibrio chagasii]
MANQQGQFPAPPKRLFMFGISSLPPRYMDCAKALGEQIDITDVYQPLPTLQGDIRDRKYLAKLEAQRHGSSPG